MNSIIAMCMVFTDRIESKTDLYTELEYQLAMDKGQRTKDN
ncbi:MAG: hypothetical protein ACFCAD_04295 [Pleurocapsa sp.]